MVDEINLQTLIMSSVQQPPEAGNSFRALLELPPNQAVKLLHSPEHIPNHNTVFHNTNQNDAVLVSLLEPDNNNNNNINNNNYNNNDDINNNNDNNLVKQEPIDSDSMYSDPTTLKTSAKRKEQPVKGKSSGKKSKNVAKEADGEELPYVHVRARRGQATDSHSLAERARREKINARMKLLQELVPGCNKISGTAMVLDEIINHVQSLQRQVEFLSMRLAAVHPSIDINLDNIFSAENGSIMDCGFTGMVTPSLSQQLWQPDALPPQPLWGVEDINPNFITPENSLLSYDSSGNSASLHTNQLKTEL